MVGRNIELADDAIALGPGLHAAELDAVVERDLLAAGEPPEEIEMPPGATIFAVGRKLKADLLLLADDFFDLAVLNLLELGGRNGALLALGARLLDRCAAQDRTDMLVSERRPGSLHG